MKSAKEIWETAKGSLQVQVNKANYETWIKDTVGISYQTGRFVVGTPKAFAKEYLEKRLRSLIEKTLISILGHETEVCFELCARPDPGVDSTAPRDYTSAPGQQRLPLHKLNPRYTFGAFVVGNSNRLAYAAALAVAEEPGAQYNPLFLYGDAGVGKSHLAHAIGNEACENGLCVAYASGEQFTSDFVKAIKERTSDQFRHKFVGVDLFIIEDIQFIIGKPQTQSSLFHILDDLQNANRQVVLTGNHPPQSLAPLQNEFRSRLECGLIARLRLPDFQTRLAILKAKAEKQKVQIDNAVCEFIAEQCQANIRNLEGLLNRVVAYSKIWRKPLSAALAREALQAITPEASEQNTSASAFTPASILTAVSNHFNISPEGMKGKSRDATSTLARQVAIYLIREKTSSAWQDIGQLLGGRDHSTVIRGYQRVSTFIPTDATIQNHISQILKSLELH
ncbi:MAG: chromosomal replication initiator protein DnaA [Chloroflexi bacterium]|nr:chromosomal replication initiator protein DnaA [Chloroflexota bacterium]